MIQKVSVYDILDAPEFPALIEEYGAESAIDGLPPPKVRIESYVAYDLSGMLHCFSAKEEGELVGFITILTPPAMPHYSCPVAVGESFFVASAHRRSMAGLGLLAAAEKQAIDSGAPGLLLCAPFAGRLFELLPKCGYVETNRVFFKRVGVSQ